MPESKNPAPPRDDRGAPVELRGLTAAAGATALGADGDPHLADLRLRSQVAAASDTSKRQLLLQAAVGAAFGVLAMTLPRLLPGIPRWAGFASLIVAVAGYATWRIATRARKFGALMIDTFLREGRCPGCAYTLDRAIVAPDGCVVCPECGAAWKKSRVGSADDSAPALREYRRRIHQPTMRERWIPGLRGMLMTRDARNQAVHVTNPRLRGIDQPTAMRLGDARVAHIRGAIRWRHRTRGVLLTLVTLPVMFGFATMIARSSPTGPPWAILIALGTVLFAAAMIVLVAGFMLSMLFGDSGYSASKVVREFIGRGVCPQCLGLLDGLVAGESGIVDCPGCGAAWKAGDLGQSAPAHVPE